MCFPPAGNLTHLRKYSTWYEAQGCAVLLVPQPSIRLAFGQPELVARMADVHAVMAALADVHAAMARHPQVIIHSFSNGGLSHLYHWLHTWPAAKTAQNTEWRLAACVMDSCPGSVSVLQGANALFASRGPGPLRWVIWLFYLLVVGSLSGLGMVFQWTRLNKLFPVLKHLYFTDETLGHPMLLSSPVLKRTPLLYLFSAADALVRHTDITRYMDAQVAAGFTVSRHRFTQSSHVAHLRTYPAEYLQALTDFLGPVLHAPAVSTSAKGGGPAAS